MRKLYVYLVALLIVSLVIGSCGLRLRERPEEIEKMSIVDLYNIGVGYYSYGMNSEAKFIYEKIVEKYSKIQNPTDEEKDKYYWALYEMGFISYKDENYKDSIKYINMVMSGTNEGLTEKSPQVVLAKKVKLKINSYVR